ncbi:MAG: hypothetical protein LQ350_002903 [Teloschistes chrysophthalmus]|nr:MAG: hypothetical protein LQ350_002903 [Niorma chrysophthalma]
MVYRLVFTLGAALVALYALFLGLLTRASFQANVVYLHKIQLTWFKDLDVPESFGFLRNQVTPFSIESFNGASLYAWHILPIELYRQHDGQLLAESSGFVSSFTSRTAFQLLRDDPEARLVIHFHGAAGTVGSGYRVPDYRALSAGDPRKIHVLTFDYRGFGYSKGIPSELGLSLDAISVVNWALQVAAIPPSRIVLFGQSLGTAVTLAILQRYTSRFPPIAFAGSVLVAPFTDVPNLVATYRLAGTIPILSPLARFPVLFNFVRTFIHDKWFSKVRIANYIRANEVADLRYRLTLIHAEDDYDIPSSHTEELYWHAVNATRSTGVSRRQFERIKQASRTDLGAAGSVMEWSTNNGVLREEILKTGLHDAIMGNAVVTLAVMRISAAADSLV